MVVCQRGRLGPSGPGAQRPVILPPLEAGGIRCSVKPASRNARRSKCRDAEAFAKAPAAHYATWNGRAAECDNQTQAQSAAQSASAPP
ncbi:hypothetical protein PVAP13_9KG134000 [Panicum virgatum]|uniref:Uncharacterized protein n=1 Tax=Panicum virgatum TaxID=38727 RepID=A0A8T0NMH1_PANVG|nr:hypothetical protein PVAP13_9KG134000 [Panicum virgatum]